MDKAQSVGAALTELDDFHLRQYFGNRLVNLASSLRLLERLVVLICATMISLGPGKQQVKDQLTSRVIMIERYRSNSQQVGAGENHPLEVESLPSLDSAYISSAIYLIVL